MDKMEMALEFVNSRWYIYNKPYSDPLLDETYIEDFSKKYDLPTIHKKDLPMIIGIRDELYQELYSSVSSNSISKDIIDITNKKLSNYPLLKHINGQGDVIEKFYNKVSDLDRLLYSIYYSYSLMFNKDFFSKLKICANPDCDWIFYDNSKNKSRKWCGNTCASLIKVRNYRKKKS